MAIDTSKHEGYVITLSSIPPMHIAYTFIAATEQDAKELMYDKFPGKGFKLYKLVRVD